MQCFLFSVFKNTMQTRSGYKCFVVGVIEKRQNAFREARQARNVVQEWSNTRFANPARPGKSSNSRPAFAQQFVQIQI